MYGKTLSFKSYLGPWTPIQAKVSHRISALTIRGVLDTFKRCIRRQRKNVVETTQVVWWRFRYYTYRKMEAAFVSCYIRMRVITRHEFRAIDKRVYAR
jgi:hypothetical protein